MAFGIQLKILFLPTEMIALDRGLWIRARCSKRIQNYGLTTQYHFPCSESKKLFQNFCSVDKVVYSYLV